MFKQNAIALSIIQYAPFVMAFIFALLIPKALQNPSSVGKLSIVLFITGFSFFLGAKVVNLKKGIIFSFGTKGMTKYQRWSYKGGYVLMLLGFVTAIVFWGVISTQ